MQRQRPMGIPAQWQMAIAGLIFFPFAVLTPGAEKRVSLLGGARGTVRVRRGGPCRQEHVPPDL